MAINRAASHPPRPIRLELHPELCKRACLQRLAYFAHEVQVIVQVVDAGQHGAEHFAAAVQVVQVGSGEAFAPPVGVGHAR